MQPSAINRCNRSRQSRPNERGVTIILVAFSMVGILAMAVLSIDVITLYLARLEAQRSADAAALTAARVISISGITGDPGDSTGSWSQICGGQTSPASQAAQAVAFQNTVSGGPASTVTVTYSAGKTAPNADCSDLGAAFGVNPMVTVQVQRTALPTFFSRIWGRTGNTVIATATAEAFNPSNSGNVGNTDTDAIIPVQPRCVKPWIVPNRDPGYPSPCSPGTCNPFVDRRDASIQHGGITVGGGSANGVIGESFTLFADCGPTGATCSPPDNPPDANLSGSSYDGNPAPLGANLEYLPGQVPSTFTALPSCGNDSDYQKAIAACDQTTVYHCGVNAGGTGGYNVDLSNNPGGSTGDSAVGTQCLIHQATQGTTPTDADSLDTSAYPFKIKAGSSNLSISTPGTVISSSSSIVSLPIYDSSANYVGPPAGSVNATGTTNVTILGFLQVFINYVNTDGTVNVTVLNVAGCGNGTHTTHSAVNGSSPVPIRLITPP
jgi:Flp pilus assembly protein TadG